MAYTDYLTRYRQETSEDLITEKTALKKLERFMSQSIGTKSYTVNARAIDDKLNAIAYVMKERGLSPIVVNTNQRASGVVDFSMVS